MFFSGCKSVNKNCHHDARSTRLMNNLKFMSQMENLNKLVVKVSKIFVWKYNEIFKELILVPSDNTVTDMLIKVDVGCCTPKWMTDRNKRNGRIWKIKPESGSVLYGWMGFLCQAHSPRWIGDCLRPDLVESKCQFLSSSLLLNFLQWHKAALDEKLQITFITQRYTKQCMWGLPTVINE